MPGKNYIKVTSILFVIGAAISIVIYTVSGLLLGYAAADTGEKLGWIIVVMCLFYTLLSVLQFIASVKGIKGCSSKEAAPSLKRWGYLLIAITLLSGITNFAQAILNGQSVISSAVSVLFGLILPALYIYGASLNEKA